MPVHEMVPLIQVFDMPRSLAFYRQLGFQVADASPEVETPEGRFSHWMWLRLGAASLMLNTAYDSGERPPRPDQARMAGHGDTALFVMVEDVAAMRAQLIAAGVDAPPIVHPGYGLARMTLTDPDGYELVFQAMAAR